MRLYWASPRASTGHRRPPRRHESPDHGAMLLLRGSTDRPLVFIRRLEVQSSPQLPLHQCGMKAAREGAPRSVTRFPTLCYKSPAWMLAQGSRVGAD